MTPAELFRQAQKVREENFAREIVFAFPGFKRYKIPGYENEPFAFPCFSVTGRRCELGCAHCRGRLLEAMIPLSRPAQLRAYIENYQRRGLEGFLLSGGADRRGRVCLEGFLPVVKEAGKAGLSVALHPGLLDPERAGVLKAAEPGAVMLDLVGDEAVARVVFHIERGRKVFLRSLQAAVFAGLPVSPHVIFGLGGEEVALSWTEGLPLKSLVVVVFVPLSGTPMASFPVPDPGSVGEFIARARLFHQELPVLLGCARPPGDYSRQVEFYALLAGANGIAFPHRETVEMARELGLAVKFSRRCCSFCLNCDNH